MIRDAVLAGRVGVAKEDAKTLYDLLSILAINPPMAGTTQEDYMGSLEQSIRNAIYFAKSLKDWVK